MAQVIYENEAAVLCFDYHNVTESLTSQIAEHNVEDDSKLLTWLQENVTSGEQDIKINDEEGYEGREYVNRIVSVIKDLLSHEKGTVFCKECNRNILPSEIKKDQASPFDYYKGVDKKTIKHLKKELGLKGRVRLPGSGGTRFFCDKGHELFGTRDWMV